MSRHSACPSQMLLVGIFHSCQLCQLDYVSSTWSSCTFAPVHALPQIETRSQQRNSSRKANSYFRRPRLCTNTSAPWKRCFKGAYLRKKKATGPKSWWVGEPRLTQMCQQEIQSCLSAEPRGIYPGRHGPKEGHFYPCLPKELLTAKEGLSRNKDFTQNLHSM